MRIHSPRRLSGVASHFLMASGLSATGNSHHLSHSACSESTRTVGTSAMSSSSVRLCRSLVKCFMSLFFAASRKVRYMIRVCQFWYGLPLDVAMTCIPDGSGSPPRSPPDDAPPRDDPWCPSSSTTTSSYTTSSMTSTSSSLR